MTNLIRDDQLFGINLPDNVSEQVEAIQNGYRSGEIRYKDALNNIKFLLTDLFGDEASKPGMGLWLFVAADQYLHPRYEGEVNDGD